MNTYYVTIGKTSAPVAIKADTPLEAILKAFGREWIRVEQVVAKPLGSHSYTTEMVPVYSSPSPRD